MTTAGRTIVDTLESRRLLATFTVTSTLDGQAGSLRDAIEQANVSPGGDKIIFDPAVFDGDTEMSIASTLTITDELQISGPGQVELTIDGKNAHRIFTIDAGTNAFSVRIERLRLFNASADTAAIRPADGGAVYSSPGVTLLLKDVDFDSNRAGSWGGAVAAFGPAEIYGGRFTHNVAATPTAGSGRGGAVYLEGSGAILQGNTFEQNTAHPIGIDDSTGIGGGVAFFGGLHPADAIINLDDNTFQNNAANYGGGLAVFGDALVSDTHFVNNQADNFGGGFLGLAGDHTHNISDSTFAGNNLSAANGYGGGLNSGGRLILQRSTLTGNAATTGGAVLISRDECFIVDSALSGNTADYGAGVAVVPGFNNPVQLHIRGSHLVSNTAAIAGGAIYASSTTTTALGNELEITRSRLADNLTQRRGDTFGAGLFVSRFQTLHVRDSEIVGNSTDASGPASDGRGGGAFLTDVDRARFVNSTIAGNHADQGGGLYLEANSRDANTVFLQSTLTANHATDAAGGIYQLAAPVPTAVDDVANNVVLSNSILSGNTAPTTEPDHVGDSVPAAGANGFNVLFEVGRNVVGTQFGSSQFPNSFINDKPRLSPLDFHGGSTRTMPPADTLSPAFNSGLSGWAIDPGDDLIPGTADDEALLFDQRGEGFPRFVYDAVDIGAAEYALAGDANFDGQVNLSDFVILRNNFGSAGSVFGDGDFNGDGKVDLADFVILRNKFGQAI